jgi:cell division protein FtsI (penicillin-binding protein 3)
MSSEHLFQKRSKLIFLGLFGFFAVMFAQMIRLHIFPSHEGVLDRIARQYEDTVKLPPFRGKILDRGGDALAVGVRLPTVYVNPKVFSPTKEQIQKLSKILNVKGRKLLKISRKESHFAYVARKISSSAAKKVRALKIKGVHILNEPARSYPSGTLAAPLVGLVGMDNQGLAGLENLYEKELAGSPNLATPTKDAKGRLLFLNTTDIKNTNTGSSLVLTIDRAIQQIAEEALAKGIEKAGAKSGFVVVADPHTGKLLAVANSPGPAAHRRQRYRGELFRNKAFTDRFEPGSIVKPFVVAQGLESKSFAKDAVFFCENGKFKVGRNTIHDTKKAAWLNLESLLVKSSNICAYKAAQMIGQKGLHSGLKKFGFADAATTANVRGSAPGRISDSKSWKDIRFANISFGQGFLVSGLEIITAWNALANGGRYIEPTLVDRIETNAGQVLWQARPNHKTIISADTAKFVASATLAVVEKSAASRAKSKLYRVAGKSGTTQKANENGRGYSKDKRIASFAGYAPFYDPAITVYVNIDEPSQKPYYGNLWAAPVFKEVVESTLKYLNVPSEKRLLKERALEELAGKPSQNQRLARKGKTQSSKGEDGQQPSRKTIPATEDPN